MKNHFFKLSFVLALSIIFFMPEAFAQTNSPTIATMFANGTKSFNAITKLVQYTAYLIGIFLIIGSLFKLSQLGSSQQVTAKMPLVMFFTGIGIFALIGSINVVSQTLSMGSGPGDALMPSIGSQFAGVGEAVTGVLTFIRLIGYIAFIRGWLMLNAAGQGKADMVKRGLIHLGGGVACINITIAAKILATTFAPGIPLTILGL